MPGAFAEVALYVPAFLPLGASLHADVYIN
jgi:hypothetical protein